jgi:3-carboxy-cis,cis-muconate cycloisomerase
MRQLNGTRRSREFRCVSATRVPGLVATLLAAMPHEHERGVGWHAEWETLPEIFGLVAGAARSIAESCDGLEIDPARLRENLDRTRVLVMAEAATLALAKEVDILDAHALVEAASGARPRREDVSSTC